MWLWCNHTPIIFIHAALGQDHLQGGPHARRVDRAYEDAADLFNPDDVLVCAVCEWDDEDNFDNLYDQLFGMLCAILPFQSWNDLLSSMRACIIAAILRAARLEGCTG